MRERSAQPSRTPLDLSAARRRILTPVNGARAGGFENRTGAVRAPQPARKPFVRLVTDGSLESVMDEKEGADAD